MKKSKKDGDLYSKQIHAFYKLQHFLMDHIPSQSISKSILIVTPLFLLVLAVLHASSQVSYLFILKFINNVAGSADLTLLPTLQIQTTQDLFNRQLLMSQFSLYEESQINSQNLKIPLIDLKAQKKWIQNNSIIKGSSPRWILPTKIGATDTLLVVLNIKKQKEIGIVDQSILTNLDDKQLALDSLLAHKLGYQVGDVVPVNFKLKNLLNGLKLFQKFQDQSSDNQYQPQSNGNMQQSQLSNRTYQQLKPYIGQDINEAQFNKIFSLLYENEVNVQYTLKKSFYPQGMYPSAFTNVIIMQIQGFTKLLSRWILQAILQINEQQIRINQYLPKQYQRLWPTNQLEAEASLYISKSQFKQFFQNYALMSVVRLNNRQNIYKPDKGQQYQQFATMLQSVPGNLQVIVLYPFFRQSLAIKYFFDSVIQIFQFVTCIIYFYTMTLIMKQIYEEKQIQVGIWRTLGAGAVSQRKKQTVEVQLKENSLSNKGSGLKYSSQFQQQMSLKEKLQFYTKLAIKVGYIYYWVVTIFVSVLLYFILKIIFYKAICSKLNSPVISQPLINLPTLFILVFIFIQVLIYQHIHRIYTNSLSETIKPVKRTFDVVKVRIIHVATFGISIQILLIAVMLVYYGVVSYYWIPFAILDGQQNLQVLLFNTIFLFMIFGAIILLGILQSRIQIFIFNIIFRFNSQMRTMKLAILKNIKAKKYKNIKVSIIISIIFAFVLFFTAGIKIQMQIVQSFIERALGSTLVFENYQKKTFDNKKIQEYLSDKDLEYSWLSKGLGRDNVSIALLSHISGKTLTPEFQVLTPQYLNSTFHQYYYPQQYLPDSNNYWKLPNKILDGFNSIYAGQGGKQSVGKYDPTDTIQQVDPYNIVVNGKPIYYDYAFIYKSQEMCPQQQVIKMVVSSGLRKKLGVNIGDFYKMKLQNSQKNLSYLIRAQLVHSFKAGPGFDILGQKAFISQQQAAYIYHILGIDPGISAQNQKLFIKGTPQALKPLGSAIITLSPQQTQVFEIDFVSQSFQLLSYYLNAYIVLITFIMSTLVTVFIFLYTLGKCRQQAEMFKMLRAIGLSAKNIRIMIFCQIIIRLIVALLGGIGLGVVFSIGFSLQIQQFLMIKTPLMDITLVSVIGICLIAIFSITIIRATKYISERSVAQTNKI